MRLKFAAVNEITLLAAPSKESERGQIVPDPNVNKGPDDLKQQRVFLVCIKG